MAAVDAGHGDALAFEILGRLDRPVLTGDGGKNVRSGTEQRLAADGDVVEAVFNRAEEDARRDRSDLRRSGLHRGDDADAVALAEQFRTGHAALDEEAFALRVEDAARGGRRCEGDLDVGGGGQ